MAALPQGPDSSVVQELRQKVAMGSRVLARFELVDYLGHLSARVSGTGCVLIRARGAEQGDQRRMTPEQVSLVDLEANHLDGEYRPPDETRLHTEVYKARPDVLAVVHTHQPLALLHQPGRPSVGARLASPWCLALVPRPCRQPALRPMSSAVWKARQGTWTSRMPAAKKPSTCCSMLARCGGWWCSTSRVGL